jgi:hypothetical protein
MSFILVLIILDNQLVAEISDCSFNLFIISVIFVICSFCILKFFVICSFCVGVICLCCVGNVNSGSIKSRFLINSVYLYYTCLEP